MEQEQSDTPIVDAFEEWWGPNRFFTGHFTNTEQTKFCIYGTIATPSPMNERLKEKVLILIRKHDFRQPYSIITVNDKQGREAVLEALRETERAQ